MSYFGALVFCKIWLSDSMKECRKIGVYPLPTLHESEPPTEGRGKLFNQVY